MATCVLVQVEPKGDRVLVKVAQEEVKTRGGILLPPNAIKKPTSGEEGVGEGLAHAWGGMRRPRRVDAYCKGIAHWLPRVRSMRDLAVRQSHQSACQHVSMCACMQVMWLPLATAAFLAAT